MTGTQWWVGTYPEAGAGTPTGLGEGIWRVDLDDAGRLSGARLVAPTPSPTFVATHPGGRVLYSAAEADEGTVTAFGIDADGSLEPIATVAAGGAWTCHLLLAPDARTLYAASYGSGTVGVLPLDDDGRFAASVLAAGGAVQSLGHTGSGPVADRQEGPHAHFAAIAPGGEHLLVCDLGTDDLRRLRIGPDGLLTDDGVAVHLPPGTGPRHLAVGSAGAVADAGAGAVAADPAGGVDLLYVVGELDGTVRVLRWDPATATADPVQTVELTRTPVTPESASLAAGGPLASHVVLDGDRLVVAVRGPDVLVVLPRDPATGLLGEPTEVPAGGSWPRHLAVHGDLALVADQGDGRVAVVRLPGAGAPGVLGSVDVPAAACVVPVVG
jgi:6-phosphogluconolactonase